MVSSNVEEVLVYSSQSSSCIYDVSTGSVLFSLKGQESAKNSADNLQPLTTSVETRDGLGGILLGSSGGKRAIHVWSYQKEVPLDRIIPPASLTKVCLSNRADYLIAGTQEGRVLIWEVSSGLLLASIDAHYRPISALGWTDDDAAFISASEDGSASVWSLASIFASAQDSLSIPTPYCILSDHTLTITDFSIGLGTFPNVRLVTSSLDGSCKIWDISNPSKPLHTTFALGSENGGGINHVALETGERYFFAATNNSIYRVDLYKRSDAKQSASTSASVFEHVGGKGHMGVERFGPEYDTQVYNSPDMITALHLSSFSPILLVGTIDSKVNVLNLPSLQSVRTISPPISGSGPVHYLKTMFRPADMTTTGKLSSATSRQKDSASSSSLSSYPVRCIGKLQKTVTLKENRIKEKSVPIKLTRNSTIEDVSSLLEPLGHASNFNSSTGGNAAFQKSGNSNNNTNNNISGQLETENRQLREKLARAIEFNDQVWKYVVDQGLDNSKST